MEPTHPRSKRTLRFLAVVLRALAAGSVLSGCFVGVRHEGCWHEGWRGPYGAWHPGHWGPCR